MGPGGRVAWFSRTVVCWSFGSGGPRMWRVVGDGCRRSPTIRLWFDECRSKLILERGGTGEHTPLCGRRCMWEEVKIMANVLNLQIDAVDLPQETKKSHKSYWYCYGHGSSHKSYYFCGGGWW